MDTNRSILRSNLREVFSELLLDAAKNQRFPDNPILLTYVTEVLVAFHETARLFTQKGVRVPVLADMLTDALESDFHRRISILKQMGDTSLLVSGYFPQALSKRPVSKRYYQKMGGIAYSHLGTMIEDDTVYDELSSSFIHLTELIAEVSENTIARDSSTKELLELYQAGGSDRVLEKLRHLGIVPLNINRDSEPF